jgi:hypothetical protein
MKVIKITYSKKFPYAPYLNESIGFEAEISENENVLDCVHRLRDAAELSFTTAHPNVVLQKQVEEVDKRTPEQMKIDDIALIMSSKTLKELDTFKLLKGIDKDYFHAYNVKEKQLQNA